MGDSIIGKQINDWTIIEKLTGRSVGRGILYSGKCKCGYIKRAPLYRFRQCKQCRACADISQRKNADFITKNERECCTCKVIKNYSEFYRHKTRYDGMYSYCKDCSRKKDKIYTLKYKKKDPDKYKLREKKRSLRRHYNMTLDQYNLMIIKQKNLCYICQEKSQGKNLHIDHNHLTNKIRKLLCSNCNTILGLAKESIIVLENLIDYLKEHNDKIE